jgi:hypothetical protein
MWTRSGRPGAGVVVGDGDAVTDGRALGKLEARRRRRYHVARHTGRLPFLRRSRLIADVEMPVVAQGGGHEGHERSPGRSLRGRHGTARWTGRGHRLELCLGR